MALSPAERMQAYRQRLKERGGKVFRVTLSPDEVGTIEMIGRQNYPGFEVDEIVRAMLNADCVRLRKMVDEQIKLRDEFGADDETIDLYVQIERDKTTPSTAEQFLELLKVRNEFRQQLSGSSEG